MRQGIIKCAWNCRSALVALQDFTDAYDSGITGWLVFGPRIIVCVWFFTDDHDRRVTCTGLCAAGAFNRIFSMPRSMYLNPMMAQKWYSWEEEIKSCVVLLWNIEICLPERDLTFRQGQRSNHLSGNDVLEIHGCGENVRIYILEQTWKKIIEKISICVFEIKLCVSRHESKRHEFCENTSSECALSSQATNSSMWNHAPESSKRALCIRRSVRIFLFRRTISDRIFQNKVSFLRGENEKSICTYLQLV